MSAAAATSGSDSSAVIKKVVGVSFRHVVDAIATVAFLIFCYFVAGIDARVIANGIVWTQQAVTHGFLNVFVPLVHFQFGGVFAAMVDNVFEWETFTFIANTAIWSILAFLAFATYRSAWVGLGMLLISLFGLGWTLASWGLQVMGPLLIPVPITLALIALVVVGIYKLSKKLWGWGGEGGH